jgi:hypothetical protein
MSNRNDSPRLAQENPPANEEADIATIAETLSQKIRHDYPPGKRALRDAHPKAHGTVKGEFIVHDNLPAECRYGVFKEARTFPAFIRFSSTGLERVQPDTTKDAHGMAIKLMGVEGEKILEEEKNEQTQDFIMVSYDVFFIRNPHDFTFFAEALREQRMLSFFIGWNPFKWRIHEFWRAFRSVAPVGNPLQIRYWSQTPIHLGPHAVKYSSRSRMPKTDGIPRNAGPDFLTEAMARTLRTEDVYFDFMVQFQTDAIKMPIEDPTIRWSENASPFVKVATVHIPAQEFDSPARMEFGDNLSFTPWHALSEHRPLGGIQRARRVVYETISKLRHGLNNAPRKEPTSFEEFESL